MEISATLWAAFLAGMLSFFSPCMIPLLPVYTSQMSTAILENKGHYRSGCGISLQIFIFTIGFILVFVGLGTASGFLGKFLNINPTMILKGGGIFVILMGLNLLGLFKINLPTRQKITRRNVSKKNYITSFFLGISLALVWTPCVSPILVSILTVAATTNSSIAGSVLLTSYSLGMVIPLLALCLMFDRFPRLQRILKKYSGISLKVSGLFLILLGLLMYFDRLQILTNVF